MPLLRKAAVACLVILSSLGLRAQSAANSSDLASFENKFDIQIVRLWDGPAPGAKGTDAIDVPTLTVFYPQKNTANGTAVVLCPGGAHVFLANNLEGRQTADWFNARGITAFVLTYRLGPKYLFPVPLWDAQRAIRLVRTCAKDFKVDPARIGIMGFSAGGHLAALAGTLFDEPNSSAADDIDKASARPDFMILGYPWLNAMQPQIPGFITYCSVLKIAPEQCSTFTHPFTPVEHVTAKTPPTFIFHTTNDSTVPVMTAVEFYTALHKAGVPAEMHIFEKGHHGVGWGLGDAALDQWSTLLEAWLRANSWITGGK